MFPQPAQLSLSQSWEVLLVSDSSLRLERVKKALSKSESVNLSAAFKNIDQAQQYINQVTPDLAIIDHLQQEQFLAQIKRQFPKLLLATVERHSFHADFCLQNTQPILSQLQKLFRQQKQLTFSIKGSSPHHNLCQSLHFSSREHELLSLLSYGYDLGQISQTLNLSIGTVNNYLFRLREKLNARDTAHLICIVFRGGLTY